VVEGTPNTTTSPSSSPPISFSHVLNKAKAASKTEKALEADAPHAQTTAASQPRKTEEDEVEEVALCMPGLSTFGDHSDVTAGETPRAGWYVDPLDVGMLGNLWLWMQLR